MDQIILVSASQISKSFGNRTLFSKISFGIERGKRVGLIGPNGSGKSTLLQILARIQSVDSGEISTSRGLRVAYLPQSPSFSHDGTVLSEILEATGDPDDPKNLQFSHELISKLELDHKDISIDSQIEKLSGGWKKRLALARELARRPDLLLLDEPTNHLDVPSILWLEEFLQRQVNLTVVTITHDRLFLQNSCQTIFDLDPRNPEGLIKIDGSYADFIEHKNNLLNAQVAVESQQRNILRREIEWLRRGAKARQTKQKARINRVGELDQKVSALAQKNRSGSLSLDFKPQETHPKKLLEAKNISVRLGSRWLFKNFSILVEPGSRIGILGKNGCGKSTLIRTLIGELLPNAGVVKISDNTGFSYFQQNRDSLNPNVSLLKTLCPEGDYVHVFGQPVFARSYLSRFHFSNDQMELPVGRLSGGEQSRLLIAQLMLRNEAVLVLDEPTNDLDIKTLDVLQEALTEFSGAVILVTHDRYFMDQVANKILAFTGEDNSEILTFSDLFQWQQWFDHARNKHSERSSRTSSSENTEIREKRGRLGYMELRELDGIEALILNEEAKLETLQIELTLESNLTNFQKLNELSLSILDQQQLIERLYLRWQDLERRKT